MSNLVNTGKKPVKMKVLSKEDQTKIRGGKELPEWLEKMVNRRMM